MACSRQRSAGRGAGHAGASLDDPLDETLAQRRNQAAAHAGARHDGGARLAGDREGNPALAEKNLPNAREGLKVPPVHGIRMVSHHD